MRSKQNKKQLDYKNRKEQEIRQKEWLNHEN